MSSWHETCACANDYDVFVLRIPKDPYLPLQSLKKLTVISFYLFFLM